ncbi:hypothetical protein [Listeria ilorinensis]|uniref:hypothetical protein n=1 Tax=Listeria ilorinensis TaxID=2867439 RepID=UPI001EF518D6|nr:hypothetical protein [Listeria ilorinensis]
MELNKAGLLASDISDRFKEYFGKQIGTFTIANATETLSMMFNITFVMYDYFIVTFSYNRGAIGCSLIQSQYSIDLDNSQKWYEEADSDLTGFFQGLQQEIEMRIPDKFLAYKGFE